jgi:hypothetical protein
LSDGIILSRISFCPVSIWFLIIHVFMIRMKSYFVEKSVVFC